MIAFTLAMLSGVSADIFRQIGEVVPDVLRGKYVFDVRRPGACPQTDSNRTIRRI